MAKIKGNELSALGQDRALRRFVHRYTKDHVPSWASGGGYPVQFASDSDWLANTLFYAKQNKDLDQRYNYCESHPTWPNDPVLRNGEL
jgi:hypothetical protein